EDPPRWKTSESHGSRSARHSSRGSTAYLRPRSGLPRTRTPAEQGGREERAAESDPGAAVVGGMQLVQLLGLVEQQIAVASIAGGGGRGCGRHEWQRCRGRVAYGAGQGER